MSARTKIETTSQKLTAGSVVSINGTYGAGCIDRSGAWSARVSGADALTHPPLSVVTHNTGCTLSLSSIVADQTYTGTPAFALSTAYQGTASTFQSGASLDFYANARLSSASFANDFVLTVLVSADAGNASVTSSVPTALKWFGSGIGDFADTNETEPIGIATNWSRAASGSGHACGTRVDGTLWCWGSNDYGQLGIGSASATPEDNPVQVGVATTWKAIAAGTFHSCAPRTNGTLWCWGYNSSGQLGLGNTTQQTSPVQVGVATTWNSVATGDSHTCATRTDGTLWCWGDNAFGQIGNGNTTTPQTGPVQVGSSTKWSSVSAGSLHTCATRTDGTLWCWGDNGFGAIGIGSTAGPQLNPIQVGSATTWRAVSAGQNHACATRTDGTLWCWGDNTHGKIGIGSLVTPQTSPVQVGSGTSWSTVATGNEHTCATRTDWTLWCWGLNTSGQLGLGNFTSPESSPTQTTESDLVRGVFSSSTANANLVTTTTQSGICGGSACSAPACGDAIQNGGESDVDCGGSSGCARCDTGESCWAARDCLSVVCTGGACQAPTCSDTFHNGDETDVDCGGSCSPCADNLACDVNADCESVVCTGNVCQVPACNDTVQNGDETDIDCGGATCTACADGEGCDLGSDCTSSVCTGNVCQAPSCVDSVENGAETDVDCGGGTCGACTDGDSCAIGADCLSSVCTGTVCQAPSCVDSVENGAETDVDCGGGTCAACADGDSCSQASDCASGVCTSNLCQVPTCSDTVHNGDETDTDCGGATCGDCADGESCVVNGDCQSNICTGSVCQAIPLRDPDNPANTIAGIHYRYYVNDGTGFTQLPNFATLGPKTAGLATVFDLTKAERADNFELLFDGYIDVPTDGVYTFYTTSDDGSKLSIGGTVVVDNDLIHTSQERSGTIGLKAGKHAIQVAYFDATSSNVLEVRYQGPGISKQVIPAGVLYRTACVDSTKVFCDGFDDNSIADWAQVYQNSPAGTWNLTTETGPLGWSTWVLRQTVYSDSNYKYLYPSGASFAPWGNQTITTWIKPVAYLAISNKGGVCVRFNPGTDNDSATGYCLLLINEASPALEIVKKTSGVPTPARLLKSTTGLDGTIPAFPTGSWKKVKFIATGTSTVTLTGYVGDVRLIEITDSTSPIATGYPAMVTRGVAFNFDEVTLSSP